MRTRKKEIVFIIHNEQSMKTVDNLLKNIGEEKLKHLYDDIACGAPRNLAIKARGLSISWFNRMCRENPSLEEFVSEAESLSVDKVAFELYKQARNGHFPSQAYYLDRVSEKYKPPMVRMDANVSMNQKVIEKGLVVIMQAPIKKKKKKLKTIEAKVVENEKEDDD